MCLPDSSTFKGPGVGECGPQDGDYQGRLSVGVGLCRKALTCSSFFFFFLGKTCFPACWRPVENWSAAAWGVKDLEAVLCEVLKPKQTLFMKPWHICVCRTSAQNVTARESRLPPLGCPFTLSFLLSPQASFCFAKGQRVEICWFKNDNLKSAVDKSKRDQKLSRT